MPKEILPNLWIGDRHDMIDTVFLEKCGIECIINCTPSCPFAENITSENIRIPIDNGPYEENTQQHRALLNALPDITANIHRYLLRQQGVLVACKRGHSRSPTIITAYLTRYGQLPLKDAVNALYSRNPLINIHNFAKILKHFALNHP
jgi:protein-tyrosine phosphatase